MSMGKPAPPLGTATRIDGAKAGERIPAFDGGAHAPRNAHATDGALTFI